MVKVSFDDVGKAFVSDQEYLIRVKDCTVEEGSQAPYFSFKLEGTGEFKGSLMYHNASLAATALWRTRTIFEAFLGEVPKGEFDPEDYAKEFIGKYAMCNTFSDVYEGTKRVKPEDFWPPDQSDLDSVTDEEDGEEGEIDLDDFSDRDIKKIGKELGIKSKRAPTIREELADWDEDELEKALIKLGFLEEEEESGIDLDEMDEDEIKSLAKAAGIRVNDRSRVKTLRKKLEELSKEELKKAHNSMGEDSDDEEGGGDLSADEIDEMDEDELWKLIDKHKLDVDLDDYKTLRKKRNAVIDEADERGLLEDKE